MYLGDVQECMCIYSSARHVIILNVTDIITSFVLASDYGYKITWFSQYLLKWIQVEKVYLVCFISPAITLMLKKQQQHRFDYCSPIDNYMYLFYMPWEKKVFIHVQAPPLWLSCVEVIQYTLLLHVHDITCLRVIIQVFFMLNT